MKTQYMIVNEVKSIWHVRKVAEGHRQSRYLSESDSYNPGQHSRLQPQPTCWHTSNSLNGLWKDMEKANLNKNCASEITSFLCIWAVRACVVFLAVAGQEQNLQQGRRAHRSATQPLMVHLQYFIAWEAGWLLDKASLFLGHLAEVCFAVLCWEQLTA